MQHCLCFVVHLDSSDNWGVRTRQWETVNRGHAGQRGSVCVALCVSVGDMKRQRQRGSRWRDYILTHCPTIVPIALPLTITFGLRVNCLGSSVCVCVPLCMCYWELLCYTDTQALRELEQTPCGDINVWFVKRQWPSVCLVSSPVSNAQIHRPNNFTDGWFHTAS